MDIFLSYAKVDQSRVKSIVALLESYGWQVWWDKRIGGGEQWDEVLERELNAAKCVVVVWSPNSISSRWVRSEASVAIEKKALVPVTIGGAEPPLGFKLIQATDLSDWNGSADTDEATALVAAVRSKISSSPEPPQVRLNIPLGSFKPQRAAQVSPKTRPQTLWRASTLGLGFLLLCVFGGIGTIAFNYWVADTRAYVHGDKIQDCNVCPLLITIAARTFTMGIDDKDAPWAAPAHGVDMKEAFAIGQHEVTNTEFVAFLNTSLQS